MKSCSVFVGIRAFVSICFRSIIIHAFYLIPSPRISRIAAPKRPCDATIGRIAIFAGTESFSLLIHFVAAKEAIHPLDGIVRKVAAIHDVTGAGDANLSATTTEFLAPVEALLSLALHAISRLVGHRLPLWHSQARQTARMPSPDRKKRRLPYRAATG